MSVLLKSFSPKASKLQSKESNKRLTKDYGWYKCFKANLSWGRASDSWRPGNIWIEDICMWYTKGWGVIQWKISLPSTLTLGHPVSQLGHFRGMWQGHRFTWLVCETHSAKDFVQKAHGCRASSALISFDLQTRRPACGLKWTSNGPKSRGDERHKSALSEPLLVPLPLHTQTWCVVCVWERGCLWLWMCVSFSMHVCELCVCVCVCITVYVFVTVYLCVYVFVSVYVWVCMSVYVNVYMC